MKVLGIVGILAARLFGKKCILNQVTCGEMDGSFATLYEHTSVIGKEFLVKSLVTIRNWFIKKADRFVSISSAISEEFIRSGIPVSRILQIYYGIDIEKFNKVDDAEKIALRISLGMDSKRYFVFTGRLINGKGLRYLLRVWQRLNLEYRDIHLTIVGSGQEHVLSCEHWLKNFVSENKLEKTVTFVGGVSDVCPYLQAGDYFVFPSKSEGLGLSLIEAMACGLACIASSVGGILDIITHGQNGLLVPYGDEDKLYRAMKEILEDKNKFKKFKTEGRQTVLKRFNIDLKAKEYLSLFGELQEN
jgi:glycosyltransferase involved in cell wall biosynthesis